MLHGERIHLTPDGVYIPRKQLENIGVVDASTCWAVCYKEPSTSGQPPASTAAAHLILSPFHPSTWPALLRVRMKLEDKADSLRDTAAVRTAGLDILSHDLAHSGHHHHTFSLVVTLTPKYLAVISAAKANALKAPAKACDTYLKTRTDEALTAYTKARLGYTKTMRKLLLTCAAKPFAKALDTLITAAKTRSSFIRRNAYPLPGIDKIHSLAFDSRARGKDKMLERLLTSSCIFGISAEWLQYPAHLWIAAEDKPAPASRPLKGTFDRGASKVLFGDEHDAKKYREVATKAIASAIPIVSCIDTKAHIMRLILPHSSLPGLVEIDYDYEWVSEDAESSSVGIFHDLVDRMARGRSVDIRHASNDIRLLDTDRCAAKIRVIAQVLAPNQGPASTTVSQHDRAAFERVKGDIRAAINNPADSMKGVTGRGTVSTFGALRLFVSKKDRWWRSRADVRRMVRAESATHGFSLSTVPGADSEERTADEANEGTAIREVVLQKMRRCHAVLQIATADGVDLRTGAGLQWILYEKGIAEGTGKPFVLLVEETVQIQREDWEGALRTTGGVYVRPFDGRGSVAAIRREIRDAVRILAERCGL